MKTLLLSALLCIATLQMPGARSQPRPGMQDIYFFCSAVAETNDGIRRDEDFADDLELVAVISAAIAAYENTSGDSFVVRSIKKSNKWHRA